MTLAFQATHYFTCLWCNHCAFFFGRNSSAWLNVVLCTNSDTLVTINKAWQTHGGNTQDRTHKLCSFLSEAALCFFTFRAKKASTKFYFFCLRTIQKCKTSLFMTRSNPESSVKSSIFAEWALHSVRNILVISRTCFLYTFFFHIQYDTVKRNVLKHLASFLVACKN